MKKSLIFILPLAVLGLVFASITVSYERNVVKGYDNFTEFIHHGCKAKSPMGGSCSATCKDAENCECETTFWSCSCTCTLAGENHARIEVEPLERTITPAPFENYEKVNEIILEEKTIVAQELAKKVMETYELGRLNKIDEFIANSKELDKEMMNLKPETLQKIIVAFSQS